MSDYNFGKSISKGETYDFRKDEGLNKIRVDLVWKGKADLDVCAFLVGEDGILTNKEDFVFYNSETRWLTDSEEDVTKGKIEPFNLSIYRTKRNWKVATIPISADQSVIGSPDVKGDEEEDPEGEHCETMHVILDRVGNNIRAIVFGAAIFQDPKEPLTFESVIDPAIIFTDEETGKTLFRYDIKENFGGETALEAGRILLTNEGEWKFEPIGKGYNGGMPTLADIYA